MKNGCLLYKMTENHLHKIIYRTSDYKVRPTMSEEQAKEEIDKASRFVEIAKSYFQQSP